MFCGFFILAGLAEIGGGYLVWQWIKAGSSLAYGITGFLLLSLYGIIPTLQDAHFGRVYAAYGGIFVVMSVLWGYGCLLYTSPSPRDRTRSRMPSSA